MLTAWEKQILHFSYFHFRAVAASHFQKGNSKKNLYSWNCSANPNLRHLNASNITLVLWLVIFKNAPVFLFIWVKSYRKNTNGQGRCFAGNRNGRNPKIEGKKSIFDTIWLACLGTDDQGHPAGDLTTPPGCLLHTPVHVLYITHCRNTALRGIILLNLVLFPSPHTSLTYWMTSFGDRGWAVVQNVMQK